MLRKLGLISAVLALLGLTAADYLLHNGQQVYGALESATSVPVSFGNPAGTTSTSPVMLGLGVTATPATTGRFLVTMLGQASSTVAGDGVGFCLRFGTGSAPGNGAALIGTQIGPGPNNNNVVPPSGTTSPISQTSLVTGLTIGTTYWFDGCQKAITGGTASLLGVGLSVMEF